jgi:cytochrome c biogenesis protein CcmG, thiol:disulfide interchange protein DsbE
VRIVTFGELRNFRPDRFRVQCHTAGKKPEPRTVKSPVQPNIPKSYSITLAVLFLLCWPAPAQTDALNEGDQAPGFSITTDQGRHISPGAFGGSLLIVNFWETSCVPCVKELPSLSDLARKFQAGGVVVVAIGEDEDAAKYARFLRGRQLALDTYRDPARRIGRSFGTYMFPETYIIQDGRIIRKVVGGIDWMSGDMTSFVRSRLATIGNW